MGEFRRKREVDRRPASSVFLRKAISGKTKNPQCDTGISVAWSILGSPRDATSSYAGGAQAIFYGIGAARLVKILVAEFLIRNGEIDM